MSRRRNLALAPPSPELPEASGDVLAPNSDSDDDEVDLEPNSGDDYVPPSATVNPVPLTLRSRRPREPSAPATTSKGPATTPKSKRRRRDDTGKAKAVASPGPNLADIDVQQLGSLVDGVATGHADSHMESPSPVRPLASRSSQDPVRHLGEAATTSAPTLVVTSPRTAEPRGSPARPENPPPVPPIAGPSSLLPPFIPTPPSALPPVSLRGSRPQTTASPFFPTAASSFPNASSSSSSLFAPRPSSAGLPARPSPLNPLAASIPIRPTAPPAPPAAPAPFTAPMAGPTNAQAAPAATPSASPFIIMTEDGLDKIIKAMREQNQSQPQGEP
ncbi:hypothetical protein C8J57DRAFT_1519233 [Mycena rebaudengoi]|nr:hypothetical protein C8J57DRAFT_1519233 [Mycena rebaudengoi]